MKVIYNYLPIIGVCLFCLLSIYATTLYPGGSRKDLSSEGFDWINNFWCNLMDQKAMNGSYNEARSVAIFAHILLCLSLMSFLIQFAFRSIQQDLKRHIFLFSSIFSMCSATFLFTSYHDLLTIIASIFGLSAFIILIIQMYNSQVFWAKASGLICLLLIAANNFIYYSGFILDHLAILQKITFAVVLLWIVMMTGYLNNSKIKMIRKN